MVNRQGKNNLSSRRINVGTGVLPNLRQPKRSDGPSLNSGSIRDAVSASNRIVVFDVSGYIVLASAISVRNNITIAGQTAPGEGIGIMAREVSFSNSSNVNCRFLRFRQGDLDPDASKSGINLLNTDRMLFDHVSIEFAQYDDIDAVGCADVTVQNSIIADPIDSNSPRISKATASLMADAGSSLHRTKSTPG